ncbi:unnamed protein product [Phaedon cochleariae]|uniref:Ionotropic receptor n=1 Tax=Phaedon cochleariae TaxID=80249 RepID=A0A9P0DMM1_PHACE|nr:unnamed protein product [Phaedon cochleariae]
MTTRIIKSVTQRTNYHDVHSTGISLVHLKPNISRYDLKSLFSTIHPKAAGHNFLVIASHYLVGSIMEYAKSSNLVDTINQWLYVIADTENATREMEVFHKYLGEGDNVAFIYNTTVTSENCVGGRKCQVEEVLKAFCTALDEAIQDEYDTASQIAEEEWEAIRPNKVERRDFLLNKVKKFISNNGVCDNCTFWEIKTGDTWGAEYQRYEKTSKTQILPVGIWRPSDGATMTDELFLHAAHGFRGKLLPMVSFHNPPWQILKVNSSGNVIEYNGMVFDVMRELAKNLNFTFSLEIIQSPFTNNASVYDITDSLTNHIPSSLVDMVKNKTVALGACAVTVTDQMKNSVNFTLPVSTQTYTFLVARPKELSRALLFISPFTGDTWICLAGSIVCMGPILYYIHNLSPVYEYKGIPMRGGLSSIQNCIWYMYGALLQQGGMHLPHADSARILVGSWWLVVLVIATTYCGNLVAFLTFPKIDIAITTVEELVAHRDTVSWSFREGSFLEHELRVASAQRYQMVYEKRSRKLETSIDNLIGSVEQGKHVFIDWKMKLQFIMKKRFLETGRCEFALGTEDFFEEELSLILPQGSPYLPRINEEIKKLHQVGLIQKWLQDYLPKKDQCWKNRHLVEVNNHTVNLDDMQGIFFVLFLGFSLSSVLLIIETVWNKHFRKKQLSIIQPFMT